MTDVKVLSAATAAAQWWAEAIGHPTFRITDANSGRDDREIGGMTGAMGSMLAERHPVTSEAGDRFVAALAPRLQALLDRMTGHGASIGVDYGPDMELADAADEAGVSYARFPWKTNMWIYPDFVTVSAGYRSPSKLVWASDEWLADRPPCTSQRWDERIQSRDYHGDPFQCPLPKYHDGPCEYTQPIALCAECGRREDWHPEPIGDHEYQPLPEGVAWKAPA